MNVTLPITFDRDELLAALGLTQAAAVTPVSSPAVHPSPPAALALPSELAGLRIFAQNVAWETPGQINHTTSNVIDASSAWLAHFTAGANSVRPGRIQVADAFSQGTFRDYIVFRNSDGAVLQKMEGITATFDYWVGPGNPDPAGTFIVPFESGVQYTLAVHNMPGVTIAGQVGLDIYQ